MGGRDPGLSVRRGLEGGYCLLDSELHETHHPPEADEGNTEVTVTLSTIDAASELLTMSTISVMAGIMTASSFPCEHGRFQL